MRHLPSFPQELLIACSALRIKLNLQAILTYHVVSGKVMSGDAAKLSSAKTVNGESFRISRSGNGLMVDDANVIKADITTSNGVIHVIDRVIMP
jgi:uncharacterized surface protein with fasciclin (FAS1) repeats